jgi:hypothetical protein
MWQVLRTVLVVLVLVLVLVVLQLGAVHLAHHCLWG